MGFVAVRLGRRRGLLVVLHTLLVFAASTRSPTHARGRHEFIEEMPDRKRVIVNRALLSNAIEFHHTPEGGGGMASP